MFDNILHFKPRQKEEQFPKELIGYHVAILATDGFEQSELFEPKEALETAGAIVDIVSIDSGKIKAWHHTDWGKSIHVDRLVEESSASEYQALILPGGVINPDTLRINGPAVQFVREFMKSGKPVAAICHGPQVLIETRLLKGRTLTSWPSLRTDLKNAGAKWIDDEVCVDGNLITSRKPSDLPAFNRTIIRAFVDGRSRGLTPGAEGFSVLR